MRRHFNPLITIVFFLTVSCSSKKDNYINFGDSINTKSAVATEDMIANASINPMPVKIQGVVAQVCQAKGCWMTIVGPNNETIRVTFKDYGFFVPTDISGKEVIVEGIVTSKELELDVAQHYAEDANIPFDATKSYHEFSLVANGVLVSKL